MSTSKQIRISITSALNAAGIEATKEQVDKMGKSVAKSMGDAAKANHRHWADIKAAWDMGCAAIRTAWRGLSAMLGKAFKFETTTRQFKFLIGDIDKAKKHMADLKALGDTPPFSLEEFAAASRSLMVMTDGALGYKASLEMIGDAAAATGRPVDEMGQAVGRLYAFIRDGEPLGRAVTQLRNMGVLTPEVARKLVDLQEAGADNAVIWAEVEKALGKYKGAMKEAEGTGEGLISAIKARWDNIVRAFGQAFQDTAKEGIGKMLDAAKNLEESGTLEVWADKAGAALRTVVEAVKTAIGWAQKLVDAYHWVQDIGEQIGSTVGAFAGTLIGGGSFSDAKNVASETWNSSGREISERRAEEAKKEAERVEAIKTAVAKRHAEQRAAAEVKAEEAAAEEKKKIADQLAEGQAKIKERRDKEAAAKAAKEELKQQMAVIKKLHDEKMAKLEDERKKALDEAKKLEENAARARGGKTFGEWQRGERELANNQRKADIRQKNVIDHAQQELARLEANARRGRAFTNKHDMERMAKLREFILNQDPNNNPALKKAQQLEADKLKAAQESAKKLEDIKKKLDAITL